MSTLPKAISTGTSRGIFGLLAFQPFALFLAVGLLGLATDVAVFSWLYGFGLSRALARAFSLACATGVTWGLNRSFTFAASGRRTHAEFGRYVLVTAGAQGVSYAVFLILSQASPRLPAVGALVIGAALATVLSFTGQRLFTFRALPAAQP